MVADPLVGFVPPPYPYDRLRALERLADQRTALERQKVVDEVGQPRTRLAVKAGQQAGFVEAPGGVDRDQSAIQDRATSAQALGQVGYLRHALGQEDPIRADQAQAKRVARQVGQGSLAAPPRLEEVVRIVERPVGGLGEHRLDRSGPARRIRLEAQRELIGHRPDGSGRLGRMARIPRPDDYYGFRIPTDPQLSPSGDRIAFTVQTVATGRFRAHMEVTLVNDGPVTFVLEIAAAVTARASAPA